ncbi:hypothetical protein GALMADRAFT_212129 [Galerina marginata CBS 339.88]|uniref:Uncharacterized protein n=1 Tax=Galerina marginata (strain CBS 339.88) TaxID=685588 RepID=A0A067T1T1_GALM3|nr:hypothetical protein GALMADRAFT_212129 [Galerina marginata CBS 339.88]
MQHETRRLFLALVPDIPDDLQTYKPEESLRTTLLARIKPAVETLEDIAEHISGWTDGPGKTAAKLQLCAEIFVVVGHLWMAVHGRFNNMHAGCPITRVGIVELGVLMGVRGLVEAYGFQNEKVMAMGIRFRDMLNALEAEGRAERELAGRG